MSQEPATDGDADEVIANLISGDRHPVRDADSVDAGSGLQAVELLHSTTEGPVVLHYNYYVAYRPGDGGAEEFDIFDEDDTPDIATESQG